MWLAGTSSSNLVGLNPLYLLTGSIAAVVAVALSVRSIVKSMIERTKEDATQKQANNEALHINTRAIEKLDSTTEKLATKLDSFTFDVTIKLTDQSHRMDEISRRLERLEKNGGN